jgi:hypothetical protein
VPYFDPEAAHPVRCHIDPAERLQLFENTVKPRL